MSKSVIMHSKGFRKRQLESRLANDEKRKAIEHAQLRLFAHAIKVAVEKGEGKPVATLREGVMPDVHAHLFDKGWELRSQAAPTGHHRYMLVPIVL